MKKLCNKVLDNLDEAGTTETSIAISKDLEKFLNDIVIKKSKGFVKKERDAALLLFDILRQKYSIK